MGVYINMEIPKDGSWVTLRIFPDGQCFLYSWCGNDFDVMEHLTAVPVPAHGRLIDADAIRADIDEKRPGRSYEDAWALTVIDAAPTIIPADHFGDATDMVKAEEGET